MHVLITGGAGFIGSHLVALHMERGDKVHVVDSLLTGAEENLEPYLGQPGLQFTRADIVTWEEMHTVAAWADRIYHLAAVVGVFKVLRDPISVLATNIAGCERLLRAVAAGKWKPQLLIASSSEVYGPTRDETLREDAMLMLHSGAHSRWNYAIAKLADEALGVSYARQYDIPITIARLFNTVGPRQSGRYGMVLPRFIEQANTGDDITVYGDGTQTRSFCDVRDTARALDSLADSAEGCCEIVNVGSDREISILELARMVKTRSNSRSRIRLMSYEEAYGMDFEDIRHRRPDLQKLRRLTGFEAKWTLEKTIDDLVDRAATDGIKGY